MAAAFSSDGADAMGRALPGPGERGPARSGPLADFYELRRAAAFVRARGLRKVALQFPDELLEDAAAVAARMEEATGAAMYVLGDTSYGSCCVDEVAAEHAGAQAVVHYGPACLSPCRRLPVLHVFGRQPLDVERCAGAFRELHPDPRSRVAVLSDVVYAHAMDELEQRLRPDYPHVVFSRLLCEAEPAPDPSPGPPSPLRQFGRELPVAGLEGRAVFYVGGEGLPLTNLMLSWNRCAFSSFDPATGRARHETLDVNRALRRRLYLVERARDARAVGILVGTLGVAGYQEALRHLRDTLRQAGKRSYTLAVGKPSPVKLANFPELDVFVLVACAQNSLLDSHDFYRPVVTPFELELACNPARAWTGSYFTDFRDLLPGGSAHLEFPEALGAEDEGADVSLITGELRVARLSADPMPPASTALACRSQTLDVAEISPAASFLESRSWRGLEQHLGQTPVQKAVEGRRGIAIAYEDEACG